jgi:hypothetical protein
MMALDSHDSADCGLPALSDTDKIMCGIAGFLDLKRRFGIKNAAVLARTMADRISDRDPMQVAPEEWKRSWA